MKRTTLRAAVCAGVWLASFCASPSEETLLRRFLKDTAVLAEKGKIEAVRARLADDYLDAEGRNRAETTAFLKNHLGRQGLVVHLLGMSVDPPGDDGLLPVHAEIMVSSGAAEALRKVIRWGGDCFRVELGLRKDRRRDWLIARAGWEWIPESGLLPESLEVLKRLFPDLGR